MQTKSRSLADQAAKVTLGVESLRNIAGVRIGRSDVSRAISDLLGRSSSSMSAREIAAALGAPAADVASALVECVEQGKLGYERVGDQTTFRSLDRNR